MPARDVKSVAHLLDKGLAEEAMASLIEMIERVPTHVAAYVLLARIQELKNLHEEAFQNWQKAYALLPASPVVESGLKRAAIRRSSSPLPAQKEPTDQLDLNLLIQELETARIIPDPNVPEVSDDDLEDDIDDLVSETLARIYANQKHYEEACKVYEALARQHPDRKNEFETKAIEMRKLALEDN